LCETHRTGVVVKATGKPYWGARGGFWGNIFRGAHIFKKGGPLRRSLYRGGFPRLLQFGGTKLVFEGHGLQGREKLSRASGNNFSGGRLKREQGGRLKGAILTKVWGA